MSHAPASQLDSALDRLDTSGKLAGSRASVDVIRHSRGGLVTRWWMEGFDRGDAAVRRAAKTPVVPGLAAMSRVGNKHELATMPLWAPKVRNRYLVVHSNFESTAALRVVAE